MEKYCCASWVKICWQYNDVLIKLLEEQGAIQKPSRVKDSSAAGQIVISPSTPAE